MKRSSLVIVSALTLVGSSCRGFQQPIVVKPRNAIVSTTSLAATDHHQKKHEWWGAMATAVAGLTLASQLASASLLPVNDITVTDVYQGRPVSILSTVSTEPGLISSNSIMLSGLGNVETMDFSMPSYEGSSIKPRDAPAFNPFGDFEPKILDSETEAQRAIDKAAEKAAKEADAAAAKADREAAVAAKKAEREAKRQEELEKQKAFKESQAAAKLEKVDVEASAPSDVKMPEFEMPDIKLPDFKKPDIDIPDFKFPDVKMPDFKKPAIDMPDFQVPDFKVPDFKKPNIDMPDLKVPDFKAPEISMPKVEMPKISLPSFGGSDSSTENVFLESQDVRDERAREARKVYLAADAEAKEAEAAARAVRNAANEKKSLANVAKDEACKTRPGGKLICLRNPFSSGF